MKKQYLSPDFINLTIIWEKSFLLPGPESAGAEDMSVEFGEWNLEYE